MKPIKSNKKVYFTLCPFRVSYKNLKLPLAGRLFKRQGTSKQFSCILSHVTSLNLKIKACSPKSSEMHYYFEHLGHWYGTFGVSCSQTARVGSWTKCLVYTFIHIYNNVRPMSTWRFPVTQRLSYLIRATLLIEVPHRCRAEIELCYQF